MLISVVIPLYNKENDIAKTLQSVAAQTFRDFEVIVVNDGSTDCSAQVVEHFIAENKANCQFLIINKPNGGVCSARNRGIQEAQGDYIALLDADDQWDKDYLKEQVRLIHDFPQAAMWGINFAEMFHDKLVRHLRTGLPDGYRGYVDDYFCLPNRQSDLFCSSSVVIHRSVFEQVGMFDERLHYSEDIDMWWRIIATHRVAFYDRYMVYYLYDAQNRAMNRTRPLRFWLPFYPEKFRPYKSNTVFYRKAQQWCAICLKHIYFRDEAQHADAIEAIRRLDMAAIPFKYRLFFHLPFDMAKSLYQWDEQRRKPT